MNLGLWVAALAGVVLAIAAASIAPARRGNGKNLMIGNPACGKNPGNAGHGTPLVAIGKRQATQLCRNHLAAPGVTGT